MKTLSTELRRQLERTVVEARGLAEAGARDALKALAVHHHEPYGHMGREQRTLRNRLRAHARHLGDRIDVRSGAHGIEHLVHECAYERWHRMLFARFLADNYFLVEPKMAVAITLAECEELAKEEGVDKWELAARFGQRMLPQVFRPGHPVFAVQLGREYRLKLEGLVEGLPTEVFRATDSLGWVYQFWQAKKKYAVNRSEVKIGANELPAVTQLFTEPYMVQFLLHNSLGAWWASRQRDKACEVDLTYLRRGEDGTPFTRAFEGWPDDLKELRLLDPCCGSGHFLVAALLMLVPMRMALEGLNAGEAVDAVLRENLHGLELDQRCVTIAAFALALEAWRYPGTGGYRTLPKLNLAWCGQPVAGKKDQWLALADGDEHLEAGMAALYDTFRDAPTLGSLIDPARSVPEDMLTGGFDELQPLLERALLEHAGDGEWEETAIAALGLAEATRLLSAKYHLVVTNVPYLARAKQTDRLRRFCETHYPRAKYDLANVFLERCLAFSLPGGLGVSQIVMPQNWLFLARYKVQREYLLKETRWELLARLGEGGFDSTQAAGAFTILLSLTCTRPQARDVLHGIDVSVLRTAKAKDEALRISALAMVSQVAILSNPDFRISFEEISGEWLRKYARCWQGLVSTDDNKFVFRFWEIDPAHRRWEWLQLPPQSNEHYTGRSAVVLWEGGGGALHRDSRAHNFPSLRMLDRPGVAFQRMRNLCRTLFSGDVFSDHVAPVVPESQEDLPAIWCFASSDSFANEVRKVDSTLKASVGSFVKVPFDRDHWERVASEEYPRGLPKPYSDDPTQWIFHGHPCDSVLCDKNQKWTVRGPLRDDALVLHVAVARLLGYRWPAENDTKMDLADEQRACVENVRALRSFEDEDGIVCMPSVRGERPASERLLQLLHAAYGDGWRDGILVKLLSDSGSASLDDWLRNQFFEQHCRLFQQRPFIWHIWDGRKGDGFHALVNYHKLSEGHSKGRRLLESLTYSYLGDWITRQQDGVKRGDGGAEDRLVAALELQKRLVSILEGEPPFDIFVRWKPIQEQSIGWEPDINDGVRLNIRPFMVRDLPGGKKGAGVLRWKPNIHWNKDRGNEPPRDRTQFPWFWMNGTFTGERVNDVTLTNDVKNSAREAAAVAVERE